MNPDSVFSQGDPQIGVPPLPSTTPRIPLSTIHLDPLSSASLPSAHLRFKLQPGVHLFLCDVTRLFGFSKFNTSFPVLWLGFFRDVLINSYPCSPVVFPRNQIR